MGHIRWVGSGKLVLDVVCAGCKALPYPQLSHQKANMRSASCNLQNLQNKEVLAINVRILGIEGPLISLIKMRELSKNGPVYRVVMYDDKNKINLKLCNVPEKEIKFVDLEEEK